MGSMTILSASFANSTTSATDAGSAIRAVLDAARSAYLESADGSPAVTLTLAAALERFVGVDRRTQWDAACAAAAASLELQPAPIIAVLGELNAGKSSVVAAFLSPAGRRRLPRGEGESSGTHRFVYWVPQRWLADETKKAAVLQLLAATHGPGHEELSHDAEEAAAQYRSGREHPERLRVPLIAGDAGLDALGAAFLDCPDVQTRDFIANSQSLNDDNPRLQFVGLAARLCSAFWVVWRRSQIRDQLFRTLLETIRTRMNETRLCLLLNMIKPVYGQPGKTRRDPDVEQVLAEFRIADADVYGAFDYDHNGWRALTAPALVERFDVVAAEDPTSRFPQFFQLSADDSSNGPSAVAPDRFLANQPPRLDPATLQLQLLRDHQSELRRAGRDACRDVDAALDRRRAMTRAAYGGLFERCRAQFVDAAGRPKQIASPEFNAALDASFRRTAPWHARVSLTTRDFARAAGRKGANLVGRLVPFDGAGRWIGNVLADRQEAKAGGLQLVEPEKLANEMLAARWVPAEVEKSNIVAAWRAVLDRLAQWQPPIDQAALDAMTKKLWDDVAAQQPGRLVLASILSLLGVLGAITAAVDGGATLLASYSLAGSLAAHLPGVAALGAAGLGAGGAALTAVQLDALKLNTLPYLRAMHLLTCDAFGLPRDVAGPPSTVRFQTSSGHEEIYSLPNVEVLQLEVVCPLGDHQTWRHASTADEYRRVVAE